MKAKSTLISALQVVFLLLSTLMAAAQWTSTGPEGGSIKCLTKIGNTTYAVSTSSLYMSSDGGSAWSEVICNFFPSDIRAMAASGNSLFIGSGSGLYRSDDGGQTWIEKTTGFPAGEHWINHLAVSGSTIFAAGTPSGLLRSINNGESWEIANSGLTDTYLYSLTANETTVFAGTGDQMLGVFRSTDNGLSWQQVINGMSYYYNGSWISGFYPQITALSIANGVLYAGTGESQGIWKSVDNGDNWDFTTFETMDIPYYTEVGGNETVLLAGSLAGQGLIKSNNNGLTWEPANNGLANHGNISDILCTSNKILVSTKGGIYASTDNAENWINSFEGIRAQNAVMPAFAIIGSNVFFGSGNGGVFRTNNEGETWVEANTGLPVSDWMLGSLPSTSNALFAWDRVSLDGGNSWEYATNPGSTSSGYDGVPRWIEHGASWFCINSNSSPGVFRSINSGTTWESVNNGIENPESTMFLSIHSNGSVLFLGTSNGVYHSIDNGNNWIEGAFPNQNSWSLNGAQFISTGTANFYGLKGGGGQRGIFRSTDNGNNWTQVHNLLVHKFVSDGNHIYASGTNLEIIQGEEIEVPSIFMSADDGINWSKISSSISGLYTLSLTTTDELVFVSCIAPPNYGIVCSNDFGTNWVTVNDGLPSGTIVSNFQVLDEKIMAGTLNHSVFIRPISDFTIPNQPSSIAGSEFPCVGSIHEYSVENASGVEYSWQVPQDWTILSGNGSNSITVEVGESSGIILVIPSNGFGIGLSQYLLVYPSPIAELNVSIESDHTTVCEGDTMNFYSTVINGGLTPVYDWQVNGISTGINTATFSYIPEDGDDVSLILTSSENCTLNNPMVSNTIIAQVSPLPFVTWFTLEPDSICENEIPFTLTGGHPEGGSYSGNGVANGIFYPTSAGPGFHDLIYSYTDVSGCSNQTTKGILVEICVGLTEKPGDFLISPNPASGVININFSKSQIVDRIRMIEPTGKCCRDYTIGYAVEKLSLPLDQLPSGTYLLEIVGQTQVTNKLVVVL